MSFILKVCTKATGYAYIIAENVGNVRTVKDIYKS